MFQPADMGILMDSFILCFICTWASTGKCVFRVCVLCSQIPICSHPGSTPLHLAARGGSLDCVRELLAWGADRLQRDSSG